MLGSEKTFLMANILARLPVKQVGVILLIEGARALLETINTNLLILQKFAALAAFMEANENVSANIHITRLMAPGLGNLTQLNMDLIKSRKNLVEEVLPTAVCNS